MEGLLKAYCKMGTVDAEYLMISGGSWPGGMRRSTVCAMAVSWDTPASTEALGWK